MRLRMMHPEINAKQFQRHVLSVLHHVIDNIMAPVEIEDKSNVCMTFDQAAVQSSLLSSHKLQGFLLADQLLVHLVLVSDQLIYLKP